MVQTVVCSFWIIQPARAHSAEVRLRTVAVAFLAKQSLSICKTSADSSRPPARLQSVTPTSVPCKSIRIRFLIWLRHLASISSSGTTHFAEAMRLTANFEIGPTGTGVSCFVRATGASVSTSPTNGGIKVLALVIEGNGAPKTGASGPFSQGILMSCDLNLCIASRLAKRATFCNFKGSISSCAACAFTWGLSCTLRLFELVAPSSPNPTDWESAWDSDTASSWLEKVSSLAWDWALHLARKPLAAGRMSETVWPSPASCWRRSCSSRLSAVKLFCITSCTTSGFPKTSAAKSNLWSESRRPVGGPCTSDDWEAVQSKFIIWGYVDTAGNTRSVHLPPRNCDPEEIGWNLAERTDVNCPNRLRIWKKK